MRLVAGTGSGVVLVLGEEVVVPPGPLEFRLE
jgi:hypothetical protein